MKTAIDNGNNRKRTKLTRFSELEMIFYMLKPRKLSEITKDINKIYLFSLKANPWKEISWKHKTYIDILFISFLADFVCHYLSVSKN